MKKKTNEHKIKIYVNRKPKYPKPGDIYIDCADELVIISSYSPRRGFVEIERVEGGNRYWNGKKVNTINAIGVLKEEWKINLEEA